MLFFDLGREDFKILRPKWYLVAVAPLWLEKSPGQPERVCGICGATGSSYMRRREIRSRLDSNAGRLASNPTNQSLGQSAHTCNYILCVLQLLFRPLKLNLRSPKPHGSVIGSFRFKPLW